VYPRLLGLNLNLQGVSQINMVGLNLQGVSQVTRLKLNLQGVSQVNMVKNKPSDVYPRLIWLKINLQMCIPD